MKQFNITGICIPERHYMVDTSQKLDEVMKLVEAGAYFTINRPRQYGKTTTMYLLDQRLKGTEYLALQMSFEGIGDVVFEKESVFARKFVEMLAREFKFIREEKHSEVLLEKLAGVNEFDDVSLLITCLLYTSDAADE